MHNLMIIIHYLQIVFNIKKTSISPQAIYTP